MLAEIALLAALLASPPRETAFVARVVDGDTVVVQFAGRETNVKLRLIGVDTPETHHPNKPVEWFGREAEAYTRARLIGSTVRVELHGLDRNGRPLAYLWAGQRLFNLELVRLGYGYQEGQYPHPRAGSFAKAEALARLARRGLWAKLTELEVEP